jgi:outer membrane lipoprotein SlyB
MAKTNNSNSSYASIIGAIISVGALVWGASAIHSRLASVETAVIEIKVDAKETACKVEKIDKTLVRIETQMEGQRNESSKTNTGDIAYGWGMQYGSSQHELQPQSDCRNE